MRERKIAWVNCETVPVSQPSLIGNYLTEIQTNYKTISCIYRSICEIYVIIKQLYSIFHSISHISLYIWELTGYYSKEIVINTADESHNIYLFNTAVYFITDMIPLFICVSIASELNCLEVLIHTKT